MSWGRNPRILSSSMGEHHQRSREGPWGFRRLPPSLPHASWLEQGEAESTLGSRLAGLQAGRALCTQHSSPRVPGLWAVGCGLWAGAAHLSPRELSGSSQQEWSLINHSSERKPGESIVSVSSSQLVLSLNVV